MFPYHNHPLVWLAAFPSCPAAPDKSDAALPRPVAAPQTEQLPVPVPMVQIPPVPIPVPGDTVPPLAGIPAGSCNPNWPKVLLKNPNGLSDAPPDPVCSTSKKLLESDITPALEYDRLSACDIW